MFWPTSPLTTTVPPMALMLTFQGERPYSRHLGCLPDRIRSASTSGRGTLDLLVLRTLQAVLAHGHANCESYLREC
jgi:hypothetical protein